MLARLAVDLATRRTARATTSSVVALATARTTATSAEMFLAATVPLPSAVAAVCVVTGSTPTTAMSWVYFLPQWACTLTSHSRHLQAWTTRPMRSLHRMQYAWRRETRWYATNVCRHADVPPSSMPASALACGSAVGAGAFDLRSGDGGTSLRAAKHTAQQAYKSGEWVHNPNHSKWVDDKSYAHFQSLLLVAVVRVAAWSSMSVVGITSGGL